MRHRLGTKRRERMLQESGAPASRSIDKLHQPEKADHAPFGNLHGRAKPVHGSTRGWFLDGMYSPLTPGPGAVRYKHVRAQTISIGRPYAALAPGLGHAARPAPIGSAGPMVRRSEAWRAPAVGRGPVKSSEFPTGVPPNETVVTVCPETSY